MKKKKSISGVNLLCWVATIIIIGICFTVFFIYQRKTDFVRNEKILKSLQERMIDDFLEEKIVGAMPLIIKKNQDSLLPPGIELKEIEKKIDSLEDSHALHEIYVFDKEYNLINCPENGILSELLKEKKDNSLLSEIRENAIPGHQISGDFFMNSPKLEQFRVRWRATVSRVGSLTIIAAKNMRSIDKAVLGNINRMKIDMFLDMGYIFFLILLVVLVAIRFAYLIAEDIRKEVKSLITLCESGLAAEPDKVPDSYKFEEFSIISKAIRTMSGQISGLLVELKTAAVRSSMAKQIQSGVLSSITHNLIGKLNNIMGVAQILRERESAKFGHEEPETEIMRQSESILASGRAMSNLLNDVNYIAALDTDEFSPKMAFFKISDFQKEFLRCLGIFMSENKIEFHFSPNLPEEIKTDRNFLKQILTNILEIHSAKGAGGRILIEILSETLDDNKILLRINTQLKNVAYTQSQFDEILKFPFLSREYASAGLRFAVARRFTELLGGTLEAKIVGSTDLCVSISFKVEVASSSLEKTTEIQYEDLSKFGLKILAVDDDAGSRQIITLMLKSIGIDSQTAENGAEALKILKANPNFDMVLMDCEMPGLNGYDTVKELRKREQELGGHITVIAMTGYTTPQDEKRCFEAGMDAFLPKPLMIEDIKSVILKNLKIKRKN